MDNITNIYVGMEGGLVVGSCKMVGKFSIKTENSQMASIGAIFNSTYHKKWLNPWSTLLASYVVIQFAVFLSMEDEAIYRPPKHSWMSDKLQIRTSHSKSSMDNL